MTISRTMPPTIATAGIRRRRGSVACAPPTAVELDIGLRSKPRSGLVGLGSSRWVVRLSTRSFKVSVVPSEESSEPLDTVTPHFRQKFASGINSAPHAEHRGTLITRQKYSRHLFSASSAALARCLASAQFGQTQQAPEARQKVARGKRLCALPVDRFRQIQPRPGGAHRIVTCT